MKKKSLAKLFFLFILGVISSFSLPPYNFFIINFFTFSIFFSFLFKELENETNYKKFFLYGWIFGFGFFSTNLYWITISLTFEDQFIFLIPFALIIIPSFLAIFYGLITITFKFLRPKNLISAFFLFTLLFGLVEFIRGTIFTGFPWNLIVYSFSDKITFLSVLSLIGTYSLNLIVLSFFTAPALFVLRNSKKEIGICLFLFLLPIFFLIYGNNQKKIFVNKDLREMPHTIRVLGSNISLDRFYYNVDPEKVIIELINLSAPDFSKKIIFLWPEGIIPNSYTNTMSLYKDIFTNKFNENHIIALGITNRELNNDNYEFFNSLSIFDNNLNLLSNYNKVNLVPFGEFLPFEKTLNKLGLETITNNFGSFSKGQNREIIDLKQNSNFNINFLPLICYEMIYTGNLSKKKNFDIILNISEDGWFGNSIGPKQHFSHSIFRAIESGKYILRSSNNGMAAIINPLGEVEKKLDYGVSGYIDLNKKRDFKTTMFSTYGNKIFFVMILLYIFLTFSFNRMKNE
ncbi:apolipoprotein N-acyltransferase [Candidatus Pelagibacter sp.]|uniref:apolipoprotein N-acyltransferase n=1 Tax=Candidatus Pelagibacter sp. TaxID=2024849 RepID=UPI003F86A512